MFKFEQRLLWLYLRVLENGKSARSYSKKSGGNHNMGAYKVVNSNDVREESVGSRLAASPNWELFGARGQRFLLPGSVGPGWHESGSMVPFDGFKKNSSRNDPIDFETLECTAQECPVLLKDAIRELFPGIEPAAASQVTVVTLSSKKFSIKGKNKDSEYHAKTFMWAAQEICLRLKVAGYWADFINPFSGRPYLSPYHKPTLYETDEKFRCIGFQITKNGGTSLIEVTKGPNFVGSLFTNAPASTEFLLDILSK